MSQAWLFSDATGVVLSLHIQPGARNTEVAGVHGDALKIRLAAPPVDGKANACLVEFLAERLEVAKSRVELVGGSSARAKRIRIGGMDAATVRERLLPP